MKPLSMDLRKRIVEARQKGEGTGEVSKRYGVSRRSVERYWKQQQEEGNYRPKKIGGYRKSRLEGQDGSIGRWIEKQNDMRLVEIQHRCKKELGIKIGINALWHRLKRIGVSYKKNDARFRTRAA